MALDVKVVDCWTGLLYWTMRLTIVVKFPHFRANRSIYHNSDLSKFNSDLSKFINPVQMAGDVQALLACTILRLLVS